MSPRSPLAVRTCQRTGRGVFTTAPVFPGATIAQVDAENVIDARRALASPYVSAIDVGAAADVEDDPYAVLCLFLYLFVYTADEELLRDEPTTLALYRKVLLADRSSCALDWSAEEVDLLAGSHLHAVAVDLRRTCDATVEKVRGWLSRGGVGRAGRAGTGEEEERRLRRCISVLLTRLVRLDDGNVALVPGLDLFNHASDAKTFITGTRDAVRVVNRDGFLGAGRQVSISYGQKTSGELLVSYGFLPDVAENTSDGVLVPFDDDVVVVGADGGVRIRDGPGDRWDVEGRVRDELKVRVRAQYAKIKERLGGGGDGGDGGDEAGALGETIGRLMKREMRLLSRTLLAMR